MTAAIGFLMIIAIVVLLLKGKMSPIVVLAVVPAIAALILRFSPVEIMGFIAEGIKTTTSNGILFIFSVIYFGVLADTGLFDVIVGWLVKSGKQCDRSYRGNRSDRNDRASGRNHRGNRSHYHSVYVSGIQKDED